MATARGFQPVTILRSANRTPTSASAAVFVHVFAERGAARQPGNIMLT